MARLVLIRHGESASNAGRWISGIRTCGGLTESGQAQARALGRRLAGEEDTPDLVLTSTMPRAVQTAELLGAPRPVEVWEELCERAPGECEGLTYAEYVERYDRIPYVDWDQPLSPGGETAEEFAARVEAVLDRIERQLGDGTAWVVCHGGVIMATVGRLVGISMRQVVTTWHHPENTSLSEWRRNEPDAPWRLQRYNDHAHLR